MTPAETPTECEACREMKKGYPTGLGPMYGDPENNYGKFEIVLTVQAHHRALAEAEAKLDRERLASMIHDEWVSWASSILKGEHQISPERRARWARLIVSPYDELSEAEKDHDRKWADKVRARVAEKEEEQ